MPTMALLFLERWSDTISNNPVLTLTALFCVVSLLYKRTAEWLIFESKGNFKYRLLDGVMAHFIYYGDDIGIDATLRLDGCDDAVFQRRQEGHAYLDSKLLGEEAAAASKTAMNSRAQALSQQLVDCRFALVKVLMPLLKELEFAPQRNFVESVDVFQGMHRVKTDARQLLYCGNDAVHTLGFQDFYAPIQNEINRQMTGASSSASALRFAPITLTPELEKNTNLILGMTGMDQVRYCLSGSEAMDAAFKDVRASTRSKQGYIVRFSSAYHGHVSGVDFLNSSRTIYLKECDPASIEFIEKYHFRISAVVVNPMQHFTGINKPSPPGEKLTLGARKRDAVDKDTYALWLHQLQDKCHYCTDYLSRVAFIMDDIYFAFRTPQLFSKNYFAHPKSGKPLQPDVLVLGKGVAAGYPLSMVLGKRGFLNCYDKKFLLQVNKTVGTLAAWHGGIVASNVFLEAISKGTLLQIPANQQLQDTVDKFDAFASTLNQQYQSENLPLRIRNFSNTFTINYLSNSLYNSRYPQYIMVEDVFLGNYSTGKFNLNADATKEDLDAMVRKFVQAAVKMKSHGYFEPNENKLKLALNLFTRFGWNFTKIFYDRIMRDKQIDIQVSHNHPVNKFGHFWSSVVMILVAYPQVFYFGNAVDGCLCFFFTHVVRQSGHFFYEQQDRNIEKQKFGHKDGSKKSAVVFLAIAGCVYYKFKDQILEIVCQHTPMEFGASQYASLVTLFTIIPHYVEITYQYGALRGLSWLIKILTDPFTDVLDFAEYAFIHPNWFLDLKDQRATYKLDTKTKHTIKLS